VYAAEGRQSLQQRFDELEKRFEGEFSIEVNRLDGEGHFALRPDVVRQTASTFKLFVLHDSLDFGKCL
jgi:beta-lactamase class A